MKRAFLFMVFMGSVLVITAQIKNIPAYATFFKEIKEATAAYSNLWNKNLYGPILLVDPETRDVFANEADSAGILKEAEGFYTGKLPSSVNVANTATVWSGKRWAMIMLPLPEDKKQRISLGAHELFHRAQPELGFNGFDKDNNHLDDKRGRIYLRLELEALLKAVNATTPSEQKKHITAALHFRKQRQNIYPGSAAVENTLELNEGLAEYTGFVISDLSKEEIKNHFKNKIKNFLKAPTFVRSFAYQTIPVYGYLLESIKPGWNRQVNATTNLTGYFTHEFGIGLNDDVKKYVEKASPGYGGIVITKEEDLREKKIKKLIADYKKKFVQDPHLELTFIQMNVSFDPGTIMPLEDKGTVYPAIRVTDKWGILTVKDGALMSPNWDKITVTAPDAIAGKEVKGKGWMLSLNEGYAVIKEDSTNNYILIKK